MRRATTPPMSHRTNMPSQPSAPACRRSIPQKTTCRPRRWSPSIRARCWPGLTCTFRRGVLVVCADTSRSPPTSRRRALTRRSGSGTLASRSMGASIATASSSKTYRMASTCWKSCPRGSAGAPYRAIRHLNGGRASLCALMRRQWNSTMYPRSVHLWFLASSPHLGRRPPRIGPRLASGSTSWMTATPAGGIHRGIRSPTAAHSR